MRLYQVHMHMENGCSAGYEYFGNLREAQQAVKKYNTENYPDDATMLQIQVTPTKAGILSALNRYAGHNDNG